tara:strand:+ start:59 stop:376 length:318 start_codon:yes stop_codon:yes gene_type:complete
MTDKELADSLNLKTEMARTALVQAIRNLMVFDQKQQDYGSKNIASWGSKKQDMFGVLTRIKDKVHRVANLLENEDDPNNESIEDNCMDIANYGLILHLLNNEKWR